MTDPFAQPRSDSPISQGSFSIVEALERSFKMLARYPLHIILLSGIAMLPSLILGYFRMAAIAASLPLPFHPTQAEMAAHTQAMIAATHSPYQLLANLWLIICTPALFFGVADCLSGRPAAPKKWINAGMGRILPLLGMYLLLAIPMMVAGIAAAILFFIFKDPGSALLVLGGLALIALAVYALTLLFFSISCVTLGGLSPWRSLRRSAALSRGNRWRILGLVLPVIPLALIGLVITGSAEKAFGVDSPIVLTLGGLLDTVLFALVTAMQVSAYQRVTARPKAARARPSPGASSAEQGPSSRIQKPPGAAG